MSRVATKDFGISLFANHIRDYALLPHPGSLGDYRNEETGCVELVVTGAGERERDVNADEVVHDVWRFLGCMPACSRVDERTVVLHVDMGRIPAA